MMKYPIGIQRKELFRGLAMEALEKEWLEYPVFHIDFNGGNFKEAGILESVLEDTVSAWERKYPPADRYTGAGRRFQEVLRIAHERTGSLTGRRDCWRSGTRMF